MTAMAERLAGASFMLTEACSICFERRCDFSFPHCQDQFCVTCIEHYFNEVIGNSWGLAMCTLKCPVCYDVLPKHVWSKYVSRDMVARYERFNQPYRPFSRFCTACGHEVQPTPAPSLAPDAHQLTREHIRDKLLPKLCIGDDVKDAFDAGLDDVQAGRMTVTDLYEMMSTQLTDTPASNSTSRIGSRTNLKLPDSSSSDESLVVRMQGRQPEKRRRIKHEHDEETVAAILAQIAALERTPDKWRALQHAFVRTFPRIKCDKCSGPLCLQCGEGTWHEGLTCEDYSAQLLELTTLEDDVRETLRWKLANSKRCPTCAVMINRDEGCNKVDCLHCGHQFCWMCMQPWSKACGFYRCATAAPETAMVEDGPAAAAKSQEKQADRSTDGASDKPEIGVPNIGAIHRKLSVLLEQGPNGVFAHRGVPASATAIVASRPPGSAAGGLPFPLWKDWLLVAFMFHDALF